MCWIPLAVFSIFLKAIKWIITYSQSNKTVDAFRAEKAKYMENQPASILMHISFQMSDSLMLLFIK